MTPPLWSAKEAARATSGRLSGPDWSATGLSIDSRTLVPGDLFIALPGATHDGHDHVAAALGAGAAAALVERIPKDAPKDAPLLLVGDAMGGLYDLARAARARSAARIIAVTGSVGKTTTKEMLRLLLSRFGETSATTGNLNNHLGLPLSLARLPASAQFGVFEIGMNHAGEIDPLTRLARPHIALVTTVEAAHIAYFADVAAIARAKAEIFNGVEPGGCAILPADNPHAALLAACAEQAGVRDIRSFGRSPEARARLIAAAIDHEKTAIDAEIGQRALSYVVGVPGPQWAMNSLAALLALEAAGVDPVEAAPALASLNAPKGRGQRLLARWKDGMIEIIDESYNANPASMAAAIAALSHARPGANGRRIAVLGDMLELGDEAEKLHKGLAPQLAALPVDLVFAQGPMMKKLWEILPEEKRGGAADDVESLIRLLFAAVRPGDALMVKGSQGSQTFRAVEALKSANGFEPEGKAHAL